MKNHGVTPFVEPLLALVGFKLLSAVHHLPPQDPEPAVLMQLFMLDHSTAPPRQVQANVRVEQEQFATLAQKAALMSGMTRHMFETLQKKGFDDAEKNEG